LWQSLFDAGLSIVIKDGDKIIGACLNFDARSDEAAPLCACAAFSRNLPGPQNDLDDSEQEHEKTVDHLKANNEGNVIFSL
jgi:hypothetical protein